MNEESLWDEPDWDEDEFEDYTFDAPVKTVEDTPTKPTPISEEKCKLFPDSVLFYIFYSMP